MLLLNTLPSLPCLYGQRVLSSTIKICRPARALQGCSLFIAAAAAPCNAYLWSSLDVNVVLHRWTTSYRRSCTYCSASLRSTLLCTNGARMQRLTSEMGMLLI